MHTLQKLFILTAISGFTSQSMSYELDTVVTTGTRTPKLLNDSPVSVNVITAEQLSVVSSGTLAEALNFIPGVTLTRSAKDGYNIQMQGFSGNRVLVLLNGQRLTSPTESGVDLDQINALDVERIEILKGAASVMYGSAAMGGVMNIITKAVAQNTSRVSYELGSYTNNALDDEPLEHRISLSSTLKNEQYGGRVNYQFSDRPGFKYDSSQKAENGTSNEKHFLDGTFSAYTPLGQINYQPQYFKENRFRIENDTNFPGMGFIPDAYESEVERFSQSLEYIHPEQLIARARYSNHKEFSGHKTKATRSTEIIQNGVEIQKAWMLPIGELVTGTEYEYEKMDLPDDGVYGESRSSIQGFAQLDMYLLSNFELLAGIRMQDDDGFGFHHASRLSGMYRYNFNQGHQLRFRFGVGQSYRVPSLKELHYIFDHSDVGSGYVIIGDENLQPEDTLSYNLGVLLDSVDGTQFEITGFYSDSNNFIGREYSEKFTDIWGVDAYVYQNIYNVKTKGGGISLKYPINHYQSFNTSYNYLEAHDASGERLENRPRHQVKFNFSTSHYWLNTKLIAYVVYQADEAYRLDDPSSSDDEGFLGEQNNEWVSLNVSVTQQPSNNLTLRYGVQNILDEHKNTKTSDDYFDAREEDSRRVYLGMSYEF